MKVIETRLEGVKIVEPSIVRDDRGFFYESYNRRTLAREADVHSEFVQDNFSRSPQWVLRGLHYQIVRPQAKLIQVVAGEVFDVAVDMRRSSPTYGHWVGVTLSSRNRRQLWVDVGFAHGFLVTSESADFFYKTTEYYLPRFECCLAWDDPNVGINWPVSPTQHGEPIISKKDAAALPLDQVPAFP